MATYRLSRRSTKVPNTSRPIILAKAVILTAVAAPAVVAAHLRLRPRSPVLRVTRSYRLGDGRTVEVAVSHYDPAKFEYAMALYRE